MSQLNYLLILAICLLSTIISNAYVIKSVRSLVLVNNKLSKATVLYSSNDGKKWEINKKDTAPPGQGGEKDWKSGYVFNKHTQKKRRNDPWWMREEESNNPRYTCVCVCVSPSELGLIIIAFWVCYLFYSYALFLYSIPLLHSSTLFLYSSLLPLSPIPSRPLFPY